MCGIAGILNFNSNKQIDESLLIKMRDIIQHRGPDDAGLYIHQNIGLAHRRLSIIDLSEAGKQPFTSEDGRYIIIFNGEIFNYLELRAELETKGFVFRTKTDTEVLLKLFMLKGIACLEQLNGMFAFAIWDSQEKKITIVRDRVGIKPLYYALYNDTLFFASEPKAILTAGVPIDLNQDGMEELLLFKYIAGENTIFKHIKRLLPGRFMQINSKADVCIKRWWNLPEKIRENRESLPSNPFQWFEETFYSSVKYRTISDVPVGVMLSGGLDSGSIAVALSQNGQRNLAAFTVEFEEKAYNEGHLAKEVANKFGLDYHPICLKGAELQQSLLEATWLHDEPLVHHNDAQMLALSKHAKKHVTVLLSGEGADELMGGYVRYKPLNYYNLLKIASKMSSLLKKLPTNQIVNRFDKLERYLYDSRPSSLVTLNASNVFPIDLLAFGYDIKMEKFEYRNDVLKEANSLYPKEYARQAMYVDLFTHMASVLDRNDRMTMGAGIECRVPFLDFRLMEMIPALPSNFLLKGKKGKYLLFNSIAKKLPNNIRSFKKLGFSVPWGSYLAKDEVFKDYLAKMEQKQDHEIFPRLDSKKIVKNFKQGDILSQALVRQLFMVDQWYNSYYKKFQNLPV